VGAVNIDAQKGVRGGRGVNIGSPQENFIRLVNKNAIKP
jgi:hypothetical protein